MTTKFNERLNEHSVCVSQSKQGGKSTSEGGKNGVGRREQMKRDRCMNDERQRQKLYMDIGAMKG